MRAHPMFGDSVTAIVLVALDLLGQNGRPGGFADLYPVLYWGVLLLLVVPVVFRRRAPILTSYLILAGGVLQLLTHGSAGAYDSPTLPLRGADFALGVALYTMVAYAGRRRALPFGLSVLLGTVIWAAWRIGLDVQGVFLGLTAGAIFGFCWVLGEFIGARKAYHNELEQRLRLLETERDQQAEIAVAQERTRIARELHDVVAHAVSVIVVQADGAAYAIDSDPAMARTAVATIAETGREALGELRRLLDVLRNENDEPGAQRAPQPGVAALPDLLDRVTAVGLPVRLDLRGEVTALPAAIGLGIYRIVQEALTNTLKHAGAGASAQVRVERVGGLVEVEVCDQLPPGQYPREAVGVRGGNGLIGMRERATVLGGTLDAGPQLGGGWRVRATFPVRPAAARGADGVSLTA
jgi:signal transduction histidine kinase